LEPEFYARAKSSLVVGARLSGGKPYLEKVIFENEREIQRFM
jgi:hypothetical protein